MTPLRRAVLAITAAGLTASLVAAAPSTAAPSDVPTVGDAGEVTRVAQKKLQSRSEVWQRPEAPYKENRTNPLANRIWGVYHGPQDQVSVAYDASGRKKQRKLDVIAARPRTQWFGSWVADDRIRSSVEAHITNAQAGDSEKLVQLAVFRMTPWEHEACQRPSTRKERTSYRRWIREAAAGIGNAPTLIVMQPDMPFLWCTKKPMQTAKLLSHATKTLSVLPRTAVYLDAGAADWCENDKGARPERCAELLKLTGIEHARGFALDSTHYTGPDQNIAFGTQIVNILDRDGFGRKHFIVETAKSGRPTQWMDMIASAPGRVRDDARVCGTKTMTRCVTLGIPPTVRVADKRYGFSREVRAMARRNVDGFVWFGRPWLHMQADPFVMKRALTMIRTTPWPGPKV